jgi:hypothetical protein
LCDHAEYARLISRFRSSLSRAYALAVSERMKLKLLLLFILLGAFSVRADVATLSAAKDTMIQNTNPDNADGGGAGLFAGTNGDGAPHRILIAFNFSSIPPGSTITNVQLTLTLAMTAGQMMGNGTTSATIRMFDLSHDWGEGTAGNPSQSNGIGASGGGFPAGTGDATWNSAFNGQTLWAAAGGDHTSTSSATLILNGDTTGTPYTWASTPQLVADVQGWLNSPASNFGWELINADEIDVRTLYAFYSREWHTFPGGNASQEPVLQVTYTPPTIVPVPAAAKWGTALALLLISWCALRRRIGVHV